MPSALGWVPGNETLSLVTGSVHRHTHTHSPQIHTQHRLTHHQHTHHRQDTFFPGSRPHVSGLRVDPCLHRSNGDMTGMGDGPGTAAGATGRNDFATGGREGRRREARLGLGSGRSRSLQPGTVGTSHLHVRNFQKDSVMYGPQGPRAHFV